MTGLVLPGFVLSVTPWGGFGELLFVGTIPALIGLMHGRRAAIVAPAATTVLVAILVAAGSTPIVAGVVMGFVGLGVGASSLRGWHTVAVVVTSWPSVLLVSPPTPVFDHGWLDSSTAVIVLAAAATAIGGAWTLAVTTAFLPNPPQGEFIAQPRATAVTYGTSLAVLLGGAAFVATMWAQGTMAGWILLTVLVVARPGYAETRHRAVSRSVGTLAGGIGAGIVGLFVPISLVVTLLGVACLGFAVILQLKKSNYALYSIALTGAIVLLNSSGGRLIDTDIQRVSFTLAGAVLAGVLVVLLQLLLTQVGRRVEKNTSTQRRAGIQKSTRNTSDGS
ncbi:hypothetical protein AX769_03825 [Frondihabitans sp. PAMC 28766]|nr:hypothetical protein AX769_03825 [Frondihabitans sp. PAMC 28766]